MTMGKRKPGERPAHVKAPAYLAKSPPVPQADPLPEHGNEANDAKQFASQDHGHSDQDPTRYGDWVHKGIAVDF